MNFKQTGSIKIKLVVIVAICSVLAFAILSLPKGFKSDLTLIGKGTATVVLIHDKNLVGAATTMALLNDVRSDYEDSVEFLAADIVTPEGQAFMRQQSVGVIELVVFGPDGTRLQVLRAGITEQELRTALDELTDQ